MKYALASSNSSFNFVKGSPEFLNILLNSLQSVVLLLNSKMELVAYNKALKEVFSLSNYKNLQYTKCGEALGCSFHIDENLDCGTTSGCQKCELRKSAIQSYLEHKPTYRKEIKRSFYNNKKEKEVRPLVYSTQTLNYGREKYLVLIIDV